LDECRYKCANSGTGAVVAHSDIVRLQYGVLVDIGSQGDLRWHMVELIFKNSYRWKNGETLGESLSTSVSKSIE
jgi:hypothetical protein